MDREEENEKAAKWEAKVIELKAEVVTLNASLRDLITNHGTVIVAAKRPVMDPAIISFIKCFHKDTVEHQVGLALASRRAYGLEARRSPGGSPRI